MKCFHAHKHNNLKSNQVVVDPSACALAFCPDPSYLEPPGLLFLALGSVIDVYSAFNLGRLSTLRLSSEDQPTEITALQSVQQVADYCMFNVSLIHFFKTLSEITGRGQFRQHFCFGYFELTCVFVFTDYNQYHNVFLSKARDLCNYY